MRLDLPVAPYGKLASFQRDPLLPSLAVVGAGLLNRRQAALDGGTGEGDRAGDSRSAGLPVLVGAEADPEQLGRPGLRELAAPVGRIGQPGTPSLKSLRRHPGNPRRLGRPYWAATNP